MDGFLKIIDNNTPLSLETNYEDFAWSKNGETLAIGRNIDEIGHGILLIDVENELIQDWLFSGGCSSLK